MSTTALGGSVGADSNTPTIVTFKATGVISIAITGSGAARVAFNGATTDTTNSRIDAGTGYQSFQSDSAGYTQVALYADNGETLTYSICRNSQRRP